MLGCLVSRLSHRAGLCSQTVRVGEPVIRFRHTIYERFVPVFDCTVPAFPSSLRLNQGLILF